MKNYKEQAQLLANYLPSGKIWDAKYIEESNLRKLLNAFGKEFVNIENSLEWLKRELNILTTYDLLPFWEKMYGIPDKDGIFSIQNKTIEERRKQIIIKDNMDGCDKSSQWENLALSLGFKCKVYSGRIISKFPLKFPITFMENPKYTIIVDMYNIYQPSEFPLKFSVIFGEKKASFLKKVFNIIKPSDCIIVYRYII